MNFVETKPEYSPISSSEQSTRPLKICVVGSGTRFLSGISYYTHQLAEALAGSQRVSVILMRQLLPTFLYPGRQRVGAKLTDIQYNPATAVLDGIDWYWLPSMLRAIVFMLRQRPEVIVFQWWTGAVLHSYLLLALMARLLGARIVIEFHEVQDPGEARFPIARWYTSLVGGLMVRLAKGFVIHSEYDRPFLEQRYQLGNRPIALIPHGPYNQYQIAISSPEQIQPKTNPETASKVYNLLFFGTIRPYKGLEDLVRAFDALSPSEIEHYRLTIVGETWEGWTLPIELVEQSHYKNRITLVNRYVTDEEAGLYFAEADAVVLPYHRSSASGPLHTTMSHGLPLVVTHVGGLVEAVADYAGAVLVPPRNPEALSQALRRLPDLCGKKYPDPHSWERNVGRYTELFAKLNVRQVASGSSKSAAFRSKLNQLEAETRSQNSGSTYNPLRVLMVAVRYYPFMGGLETHVYEVSQRMAKAGIAVTVVTTNPDGDLPNEEWLNGVRVWRVRSWPKTRDITLSLEMVQLIQNGNWDVIHCQGYHTLFTPLAMLAAIRARVPYILSFHSGGHSSPLRNSIRGVQRQVLRPLLARAARLVAVSQFEADFFQRKLRLPAQKFVVIPNGAALPQVEKTDWLSSEPGEPGNKLILSVGRLERYKGHHRVIAAFPKVLEQYPQAHLRVVGSGPYEPELRQMVQQLGLTGQVEIGAIAPEDRQGMAGMLGRADLVTLMSDYEAHPLAVMEALAMRRPVLVAHSSGLQELAERGLVHSIPLKSNSAELAQAVINQLDRPFVPAQVELPTWESCTADLIKLYNSMADRGAREV